MPIGHSTFTVTDQFCGAGGSSTGAKMVPGVEVRMAMNHWDLAIRTHNTNHPEADHDCADISGADPRRYPYTDLLITSPECTTYSNGAAIKNADPNQPNLFHPDEMDPSIQRSRATMLDVVRWAEHHRHDAIIVENVVEVRRKYHQWETWLKEFDKLGYRVQFCLFNSRHFHPTPQSRDRVYIVFTKKKNPAPDLEFRPRAHCHQCERDVESIRMWKDVTKMWGKYGYKHGQYFYVCPNCRSYVEPYYYAAMNIIDWKIPMPKVGDRKKPLSKRTLERIEYGLKKFARPYVVELKQHNNARPLSDPLGTVVAGGNHAFLAAPPAWIIEQRGREFPVRGLEDVVGTVVGSTTHHYLAVDPFLFNLSFDGRVSSLGDALPTQTTQPDKCLVVPPFVAEQWGRVDAVRGLDDAIGAVVARSNPFLVAPFILDGKGPMAVRTLDQPMSTQATRPQHFLCTYYGSGGAAQHLGDAFPTVTTRDRAALVEFDEKFLPPVMECGFRMFEPSEIKRAMAFPDEYVILGSKDDQVAQAGNAVTAPVMKWLVERVVASLEGSR
jgi:DNA (cytosine-5)-methyltransferase 1